MKQCDQVAPNAVEMAPIWSHSIPFSPAILLWNLPTLSLEATSGSEARSRFTKEAWCTEANDFENWETRNEKSMIAEV